MFALARIEGPSGEVVTLGHGALIGRLWSADLSISDPRVSEAHAMVSLRGFDVRLLALRGRFLVDGRWLSDVVLAPGMSVELAEGLAIRVLDVQVPDEAVAVEADGLARQVLSGVTSLYGGGRPRVIAGWKADADDHVWPDGDLWMRGGATVIGPGDAWDVAGTTFRVVSVRAEGASATVADPAYTRPATIIARWDTVHLLREGQPSVVLTGHMALAISQLVTTGTALQWEDLARLRWRDGDRDLLRHRWDMQMRRLRQRLLAVGFRTDLLRADGSGLIDLVLAPGDTVVDET